MMRIVLSPDQILINKVNVKHFSKHSVVSNEIKELFQKHYYVSQAKLGRLMVLGKTSEDRTLSVILELIAKDRYYVVTARDASRKERKIYDQQAHKN